MHVIVSGSRTVTNEEVIAEVLASVNLFEPIESLTTGAAPGVDLIAKEWAYKFHIRTHDFPADWNFHRNDGNVRKAGPIRNRMMVKDTIERFPEGDVVVLAFVDKNLSDSKGTNNLVETADKQKLPIFVYRVHNNRSEYELVTTLNYNPIQVKQ